MCYHTNQIFVKVHVLYTQWGLLHFCYLIGSYIYSIGVVFGDVS